MNNLNKHHFNQQFSILCLLFIYCFVPASLASESNPLLCPSHAASESEGQAPNHLNCTLKLELPTLSTTEIKPKAVEIKDIQFNELDINTFIQEENNRQEKILSIDERNKQRVRDDANIDTDRHQYYLDNFRLPEYLCDLPIIPTRADTVAHYSMHDLKQLDADLAAHYSCINTAGERDRAAFKELIRNKLDGKILASDTNEIRWSVYTVYSSQTQSLMTTIDKRYNDLYKKYIDAHNTLQKRITQLTLAKHR